MLDLHTTDAGHRLDRAGGPFPQRQSFRVECGHCGWHHRADGGTGADAEQQLLDHLATVHDEPDVSLVWIHHPARFCG